MVSLFLNLHTPKTLHPQLQILTRFASRGARRECEQVAVAFPYMARHISYIHVSMYPNTQVHYTFQARKVKPYPVHINAELSSPYRTDPKPYTLNPKPYINP